MRFRKRPVELCFIALLLVSDTVKAQENDGTVELDHKLVFRGRTEAETLWRRGYTVGDEVLGRELTAVLDLLTADSEHDDAIQLKIHIFRSPVLNAFALPDGSLFISTGLLAQLDSMHEVAFVLGHEAQHSLGWHAQKNIAQIKSKAAIWEGLSLVIGMAGGGSWGGLFAQLGLDLAAMASISGYGRGLESEADEIGLELMEAAGFDPCAGVRALNALRQRGKGQSKVSNFFWGSHPLLDERIESIQDGLTTPCELEGDWIDEEYATLFKWPLMRMSAELWINDKRPDMARPWAEEYAAVFDEDPAAHVLLGDVHLVYNEVGIGIESGQIEPPEDEDVLADLTENAEGSLRRANLAFQRALVLADGEYRPAFLGLALTQEAQGDTLSCVRYLERYLEGDEKVPRRRAMKRKLQEYREIVSTQSGITPE